jgi:ATP-binding protein involved in chromosome partitioning
MTASIAVCSGKGGVGKSTVSLNLALALHERGRRVGLLDADFYGPDIPLMVNLKRSERLERWEFWARGREIAHEPVVRFGIKIMSAGFFLAARQAFTMPAQWTHFVGRQLVQQVSWGELDYLVVDLPPGTADLQQELIRLLRFDGALMVVGPQDVAHLDGKKMLELLRDEDIRVLGGVENMAGLVCPHCGEVVEVFPQVRDGRSIWSLGVRPLARIPLDPAVAQSGDRGQPLVLAEPEGVSAAAFRALAAEVEAALQG